MIYCQIYLHNTYGISNIYNIICVSVSQVDSYCTNIYNTRLASKTSNLFVTFELTTLGWRLFISLRIRN